MLDREKGFLACPGLGQAYVALASDTAVRLALIDTPVGMYLLLTTGLAFRQASVLFSIPIEKFYLET